MPLKLRSRCRSSRSGLCVARGHKADKHHTSGPERSTAAGATQSPREQSPTGQRHKQRNIRETFGPGFGLRHRPPPDPGDPPLPALLRPAGHLERATHLVALQLTRGSWRGRAGCRGTARGEGASRRAERSPSGSRGGVPEQSPPPHFLPGGWSPGGGAWRGTALLCVAGPVSWTLRRRPPSGWQWDRPFYSRHKLLCLCTDKEKAEQTIGPILWNIIQFLGRA